MPGRKDLLRKKRGVRGRPFLITLTNKDDVRIYVGIKNVDSLSLTKRAFVAAPQPTFPLCPPWTLKQAAKKAIKEENAKDDLIAVRV